LNNFFSILFKLIYCYKNLKQLEGQALAAGGALVAHVQQDCVVFGERLLAVRARGALLQVVVEFGED
jgi:hypothetical protein